MALEAPTRLTSQCMTLPWPTALRRQSSIAWRLAGTIWRCTLQRTFLGSTTRSPGTSPRPRSATSSCTGGCCMALDSEARRSVQARGGDQLELFYLSLRSTLPTRVLRQVVAVASLCGCFMAYSFSGATHHSFEVHQPVKRNLVSNRASPGPCPAPWTTSWDASGGAYMRTSRRTHRQPEHGERPKSKKQLMETECVQCRQIGNHRQHMERFDAAFASSSRTGPSALGPDVCGQSATTVSTPTHKERPSPVTQWSSAWTRPTRKS